MFFSAKCFLVFFSVFNVVTGSLTGYQQAMVDKIAQDLYIYTDNKKRLENFFGGVYSSRIESLRDFAEGLGVNLTNDNNLLINQANVETEDIVRGVARITICKNNILSRWVYVYGQQKNVSYIPTRYGLALLEKINPNTL